MYQVIPNFSVSRMNLVCASQSYLLYFLSFINEISFEPISICLQKYSFLFFCPPIVRNSLPPVHFSTAALYGWNTTARFGWNTIFKKKRSRTSHHHGKPLPLDEENASFRKTIPLHPRFKTPGPHSVLGKMPIEFNRRLCRPRTAEILIDMS